MRAINLPKVALGAIAGGIRTRDLLIASPAVVNRLINYVVMPQREMTWKKHVILLMGYRLITRAK